MRDIVIIGGGGHAKVILSIIRKSTDYNIVGYTDIRDFENLPGCLFLGQDSVLEKIIQDNPRTCAVIGLGMLDRIQSQKRIQLYGFLNRLGYELLEIISPDATINEEVSIGNGTVVMDGVIVNTGVQVGCGVILNTNSSVDHDCNIGDFSHIAPGATICGSVNVGNNVFIGAGSVISQGITIAEDSIIGAGSVVINDIEVAGSYAGNPVRKIS
jgi:sugar O-acyltransferase (sialic acid O-acetyltransferase NeuD family)